MKTIALIYGGNSCEADVSCLTALKTKELFEKDNRSCFLVFLDRKNKFYVGKKLENLDNYKKKAGFINVKLIKKGKETYFKGRRKKYYFDEVMILAHGRNGEDGTIHSYFRSFGIETIGHSMTTSALVQNKYLFKRYLQSMNIPTIKSEKINRYDYFDNRNTLFNKIKNFSYPLVVKCVSLGSSIGVYLVNKSDELIQSIENCFKFDFEVLIEEYISNKLEINVALLGYNDEIYISNYEVINNSSKILDFYDKYDYSKNNTKRVIKERIDSQYERDIVKYSKKIFKDLSMSFVCRFDFILDLDKDKIFLNEANSIPGSIAYYLFEDVNLDGYSYIARLIKFGEKCNKDLKELTNHFDDNYLLENGYLGLKSKLFEKE